MSGRTFIWTVVALAWPCVLPGQTCSITSPTASQLIQAAAPLQLTATISSAPTAYSLEYDIDGQRWRKAYGFDQHPQVNDFGDSWQGPWVATWYTGLNGDGTHFVSGILRDIFGNTLATCPTVNFIVRIEGMNNQSINALPNYNSSTNTTSGIGKLGMLTFDGANHQIGPLVDGIPFAYNPICGQSGATSQSGGWQLTAFNTACVPNGLRTVLMGYNQTNIGDPYLLPLNFTASGNVLTTATPHYSLQGSVVTFSTTGSLPAPLVAGSQWYWPGNGAGYANTVTSISVSGAVMTINTSSASGVTAGTPVYVRNTGYTNQTTGSAGCDGYYTASGGSGTSFSLPLPATCPNGTVLSATNSNPVQLTLGGAIPANLDRGIAFSGFTGNWAALNGSYQVQLVAGSTYSVNVDSTNFGSMTGAPIFEPPGLSTGSLEVDVNPYFVQYLTATTFSVAATLGGSTVTLTNSGSGTQTVTQRIRSPYWTGNPGVGGNFAGDQAQYGGPAYVITQVNFSNGATPMEIEVPYWEMHMIAGAATQSVCPHIKNTDLSLTAIACNATGLGYLEVNDGGISGVCSVDSSGNVTPLMAGWCQVQVSCTACAAGGVTLQTATVYIQVHSGSITNPHFTHGGTVTNSFSPGNSFFPLSAWQLDVTSATAFNQTAASRPLWYGPVMQTANLNSSIIAPEPSNTALGDPTTGSCFSTSWPSTYHAYQTAFAEQYGTYFELDTESTQWGAGGPQFLAAFLNNSGYNRQSCFAEFLSQLVSEGRTWKTVGYDELNQYMAGSYPFRNPFLGSTNFPSIVISGGVTTYNVGESFPAGTWNQSTGNGSWIKMAGAVTNTCLNGWFPVTSVQTSNSGLAVNSFTTPTTCANGTYTESTAQLYHYPVGPSGGVPENVSFLPRLLGTPSANASYQGWDSTYFTQVVVSGGVATFTAQAHNLNCATCGPAGQAIRVFGSVNNLNTVKPVAVIDANHFSITYNSAVETVPANGTYTSANDAGLYWAADENFPSGTPFLALRNIFKSVSGDPANSWGIIGFTYDTPSNPAVRSWAGNSIGSDATFNYIPSAPNSIYGPDTSVWYWGTYSQGSSGLNSRGYQLQPRSMLWGGGLSQARYCRTFQFDPGCDRPLFGNLTWRPETLVAQIMGMLPLNIVGLRWYNFFGDMTDSYNLSCCGQQEPGTGAGSGFNQMTSPKQWNAMAQTNALITLRTDTELQPPCNKPYYGPYFITDCHTSAGYGNQFSILCQGESPYGQFPISLNTFSGGSVVEYVLTGYSLSVQVVAGNPSTLTGEWCQSPGRSTTFVALPPSPTVQPIDHITFAPPVTLPFGAAKFLLQVGYYPGYMQDNPVTDCTAGCTIAIDHHNTAAWYRVIYANSNDIPLSIGNPVQIPSQGLY